MTTNARVATETGVIQPSRNERSLTSFSLETLMDEIKRREMGRRIHDLRERSYFTQPQVAERLGIGLRAYQKLEVRGTTKLERVEQLAEIFNVSADWIWDGHEAKPDLAERLQAIEHRVNLLERSH